MTDDPKTDDPKTPIPPENVVEFGKPKGMGGSLTGRGVKQGPARVRASLRRARALEMRVAGFGYDDIASELGYANKSAAYKAVDKGLRETLREASDALRQLECDRLDTLIRTLYPGALKGSLISVDRILKLMERKSKLLGLDAPSEVRHSGTGESGEMALTIRRIVTTDPEIAGRVVSGAIDEVE